MDCKCKWSWCSKRCWALFVVYLQMSFWILEIIGGLVLLFSKEEKGEEWTKEPGLLASVLLISVWSIPICMLCISDINRERVGLVKYYLVWNGFLIVVLGISVIWCLISHNEAVSAIITFVVTVILFIIVFIYYRSMAAKSSPV